MKHLKTFLLIALSMLLFGCNSKWEYKVVKVPTEGFDRSGVSAAKSHTTQFDLSALEKLGEEGWELATSYLEMETSYPNFGNDSYVTGLQPNIRPQVAILIFKRKK